MQTLFVKDESEYNYFLTFKNGKEFIGTEGEYNKYKFPTFYAMVPIHLEPKEKKSNKNSLIFGKDTTQNIVSIEVKEDKVYLYKSDGTCDIQDYYPYLLGSRSAQGASKLKGNQYYKYIKKYTCLEYANKVADKWNPSIFIPRSIEEGYMMLNGVTYFKGMKVNEISVLSTDIEATGVDKDADNAETILISNTYRDRSGNFQKKLFDIFDYESDKAMIADWCKWVNKVDPDVIIGHNVLGYDFGYLFQTGGSLPIGRDGSEMTFDEKPFKVTHAGLDYSFINARVFGREIIDTQILSMKHDFDNSFPSYGLKAIEQHLKLVDDSRTDWDFNEWPTREYRSWPKEIWQRFRDYCQDDGDSPVQMFDIMIPAFFYLNQAIPKSLQDIINQRTGSQIDSMMIRSYLQDGYSQPKSSKKEPYKGAISMGIAGAYKNVRKFDVASLYPSIMLEQNIYDKVKDPNRHMLQILEYFRDERLTNKALAAEGSQYHDDLQAAQKIVINSMYGFLGTTFLLYNFMAGADAVTARGREILQIAVEWACGFRLVEAVKKITNKGKEKEKIEYHWVPGEKTSEGLGYQLVNTDTDAISITNGKAPTKEEFDKQIAELNSLYSKWIDWEDDGVFQNFIVAAAKNYVIQTHPNWAKPKELNEDGTVKVKYKGSKFKDSKKEPILKRFLMDTVNTFLRDDIENFDDAIFEKYAEVCRQAVAFKDVNDWTVKKSVSKAVVNAKTDPNARPHEKDPWRAIQEALDEKVIESIQEGDKIWVYRVVLGKKQQIVKGEPQFLKKTGEPKLIKDAGYRFAQLYKGDQDPEHYLNRAHATLMQVEELLDKSRYPNYSKAKQKHLINEIL